jgi:hypothetical protein
MGWSLPEVPEKDQAPSWSPWICLLIIILGLFTGLLVAVLKSLTTGLLSLSSGAWLPLTIKICGHFGSHRGLHFQPGNAGNSCLELE